MADTLVSARIPSAKKESGTSVLKRIGATTSDLINVAFDYVLEHERLPATSPKERPSVRQFKRFVESSTLKVDWGASATHDGDYKRLISAGKMADYESLA